MHSKENSKHIDGGIQSEIMADEYAAFNDTDLSHLARVGARQCYPASEAK
jgi:hypothetical protein